jgi:hypothetical protein
MALEKFSQYNLFTARLANAMELILSSEAARWATTEELHKPEGALPCSQKPLHLFIS